MKNKTKTKNKNKNKTKKQKQKTKKKQKTKNKTKQNKTKQHKKQTNKPKKKPVFEPKILLFQKNMFWDNLLLVIGDWFYGKNTKFSTEIRDNWNLQRSSKMWNVVIYHM